MTVSEHSTHVILYAPIMTLIFILTLFLSQAAPWVFALEPDKIPIPIEPFHTEVPGTGEELCVCLVGEAERIAFRRNNDI